MNNAIDFGIKMAQIIEQDKSYSPEAYDFVMNALRYTLSKMDEHRHINGKELLYGIRDYALEEYGPMARTVLEYWGIKETADFGEVVFNLVEAGIIRKTAEDNKEEFRGVFDFKKAFDEPFKKGLSPVVKTE